MTETIRVSRQAFKNALERWAKENPERAAFVTLDIPETATYRLTIDGNAGFGVTQDGELIALFNHTAPDGTGAKLIERAKETGEVDHLWCFDGKLVEIYKSHGFEVAERFPWDESKAPEAWNYEKFGQPDLVKMEL